MEPAGSVIQEDRLQASSASARRTATASARTAVPVLIMQEHANVERYLQGALQEQTPIEME